MPTNDKEKHRLYMREYHAQRKNDPKYQAQRRQWTRKGYTKNRTRTLIQHSGHEIEGDIYEAVIKRFWNVCVYCGNELLSEKNLTIDHMMPVSLGGTSDLDNLVVCCTSCNRRKRTRSVEDYMQWIWFGIKKCTRCGLAKPLDEYHRLHEASDGRVQRCKQCCSEVKQMRR